MKRSEGKSLSAQVRKELEECLDWNLDTADKRQTRRRSASAEELKAFYNRVLPHLQAILEACDRHALGELPGELQPYYNIALSLAEVAPHVELYGGSPNIPYAFDETKFVAWHGISKTWRATPPYGQSDEDD